MKILRFLTLFTTAFLVAAFGAEPDKPTPPGTFQLSIATDKTTYLPAEDIKVAVELINLTDHTVTLDKFFSGVDSIGYNSGVKFIFTLNGKPIDPKYIHSEQLEDMSYKVEKRVIKSGELLKFDVTLNRWYQLDGLGEFTVKAEYSPSMDGKAETFTSNIVKFTRTAPPVDAVDKTGKTENAEALRDLQSGTPKYYLIGIMSQHDKRWQTILKQEYGVELVLLGCVPVPPVSEHANRYNEAVLPALKKKHGEDFLKTSEEKAKASAAVQPGQATLRNGDVPLGSLGFPVGSYLTIEGVREDEGKTGVQTLRVETVNGVKLSEPVALWIENIDALPKDGRVVLKGYETLRMIGRPPALDAAAKEAGREAPPQPQAGWQVQMIFWATSAVSPADLKAKQGTAEQPAPVGSDVAKLLAQLPPQRALRAAQERMFFSSEGTMPRAATGISAEQRVADRALIEKTKAIIPKVRSLIAVGSSVFDYPSLIAHGDIGWSEDAQEYELYVGVFLLSHEGKEPYDFKVIMDAKGVITSVKDVTWKH